MGPPTQEPVVALGGAEAAALIMFPVPGATLILQNFAMSQTFAMRKLRNSLSRYAKIKVGRRISTLSRPMKPVVNGE
ncbi:hypothetical protein [Arthrobacter sp. TE12232]